MLVFTVASLNQAVAAVEATEASGVEIGLLSTPSVGAVAMGDWFAAMAGEARARAGNPSRVRVWLDCSGAAAAAMAAIATIPSGLAVDLLVFDTGLALNQEYGRKLAAMAAARGIAVVAARPTCHDLSHFDSAIAAHDFVLRCVRTNPS